MPAHCSLPISSLLLPAAPAQAYKTYRLGGEISELLYSPAAYGIDLSSRDFIKPRARAAPMLCVLRNTLWMLGGQVEISHTDIVLGERVVGGWTDVLVGCIGGCWAA